MAFIRKKVSANPSGTANIETVRDLARSYSPNELREIAKAHGIETDPLDVYSLTSILGIRLLCIPMSDEVSGSLTLTENSNSWTLKVNALHHPNRQRFTIAHELAHFARHRNTKNTFIDQNFFRNGETNPMEIEANRFAGELLMPESDFRRYVSTFNGSIEAISRYFKVSTLAVRVRAKSLGMTGHGL